MDKQNKQNITEETADIKQQNPEQSKKKNRKFLAAIGVICICVLAAILGFLGVRAVDEIVNEPVCYKPMIYIYPETEMEVTVELGNKEAIICSYPEYIDKWSVLAKPNGDLTSLSTGRNLYALYYESKVENIDKTKEGFVVAKEDTIEFMEEKLALLGLNEREAEEMIVYWLPKLQANDYNYIRFATMEEVDTNMPLNISPKPDAVIRVWMVFKGLDGPIDVEPQELQPVTREGYMVVEWGGIELN
jgi:hypothetical protein